MGVGGLTARPTFLPSYLIFQMSGRHLFAEFHVDDHFVRAGLGKRFEQNFRLAAHEMDVKKNFRQRPDGFDDLRAEGNVRHEMAVHDVEVQPVGAGLGARTASLPKTAWFPASSEGAIIMWQDLDMEV